MALDIDTDGIRRASEFVSNAGAFLHPDLDADVPACGSDDVSQSVMNNLNSWRRWLLAHVRSGATQISNAAAVINDTANSFEAQDAAAAAGYGVGGSDAAPAPEMPVPPAGAPAPAGMPTFSAIPDISGADGETVAQQLEAGPGAGPAISAAAHLTTLSAQAQAAYASLTMAQGHIVASGQSQAHPGLMRRLDRAIAWTAGVAGQADALAAGYGSAAELHTSTMTVVGPSAGWRILKASYADAVMENQMTGGLSRPKVDALQAALTDRETRKGAAMSGYQVGGQTVSTPSGDLLDPGLDPSGDIGTADKPGKGDKGKNPLASEDGQGASSLQDMLGPLMGALAPLMQSLGNANPLSSLGQAAQQVSKLGGDAAKKAAGPIKPAALAKPAGLGGKGGRGGGKGGGGSPIKPSTSLAGVRAASLSGSPSTSATTGETIKPTGVAPARATGAGAGGGMGMMPMGHKPSSDEKTGKIRSYEDPLAEVEEAGRPGVEGEVAARTAPVVNPESQNAVKERLARRKRDAAVESPS